MNETYLLCVAGNGWTMQIKHWAESYKMYITITQTRLDSLADRDNASQAKSSAIVDLLPLILTHQFTYLCFTKSKKMGCGLHRSYPLTVFLSILSSQVGAFLGTTEGQPTVQTSDLSPCAEMPLFSASCIAQAQVEQQTRRCPLT